MKKLIYIFILTLSATADLVGQDSTKNTHFTLPECVDKALEQNLDIQQANIQMDDQRIQWEQSKLDLLPYVNANINHGINQGRSIDPFTNGYINQRLNYASYGVNSGVVLFQGLSLQQRVKQYALGYQAAKMDWQQAKDNITIAVYLAYLDVLRSQDLRDQIESRIALSKNQVDRLDLLNREGAISPSELTDLKGQFAGDRASFMNAQNNVIAAKIALCQLMNIPYDPAMELEEIAESENMEYYGSSPDVIYQISRARFAQVQAAHLRTESSVHALRSLKGSLFPTLSLGANAGSNYSSAASRQIFLRDELQTTAAFVNVNGSNVFVQQSQPIYQNEKIPYSNQLKNNISTSIGLSLQIPIFNNWQTRNRIRRAKLQVKNYQLVENNTQISLQQDIAKAYADMSTAFDRYQVLSEQVLAYEESFRAAEIRFNEGVGNSIDYLTAKNNLDRARIDQIISRYDYLVRVKVLDYYQGN